MNEFDFIDPDDMIRENHQAAIGKLATMLAPSNTTVRAFAAVLATELHYRIAERKLQSWNSGDTKERDMGHVEALLELSNDLKDWIDRGGGKRHGN